MVYWCDLHSNWFRAVFSLFDSTRSNICKLDSPLSFLPFYRGKHLSIIIIIYKKVTANLEKTLNTPANKIPNNYVLKDQKDIVK